MENINIVTGYWHVRQDRDPENYLSNFKNILRIPCNMTIFVPKIYRDLVVSCRKSFIEKTDVIVLELEEIRSKYFSEYWDRLQAIRTTPAWFNSTHWLKTVPQSFSEWYNPVVMSKVFFIETAHTKNLFKSDTYVWVDAGITQHIPKELVCLQSITSMAGITKSILFTAFEYINAEEVHGFKYEGYRKYTNVVPNWVCRATIFSCKKQYINTFLKEYRYYLKDTLDRGYLGTEESIFTLLSAVNPALYRTRNTGRSSMPVDFLDNLIHNVGTGANI